MHKASTFIQASGQEREEEDPIDISIEESFEAIVAHLKNIQVRAMIEVEQS